MAGTGSAQGCVRQAGGAILSRGLEVERGRLTSLGLPAVVVSTIQDACALSSSRAYMTHWQVIAYWCKATDLNPQSCPLQGILDFLQGPFDSSYAPSTLRAFAAVTVWTDSRSDHWFDTSYNLATGGCLTLPKWLQHSRYQPEPVDSKCRSHA